MIENMLILISQGMNLVFQIILFGIIPFGWYIISRKTSRGFFKYIGIQNPKNKAYSKAFKITALAYIFSMIVIIILEIVQGGMTSNSFANTYDKGFLIYSSSLLLFGLQTGVSEEIFFRGFLGKRLIQKYGFLKGNILQTIIFICPHIMTFGKASFLEFILGMINAGIMGFAFGYIMDKKSEGSIIPVIICHAIVNIISSIIVNTL